MSQQGRFQDPDRIPSYEESVAASRNLSVSPREKGPTQVSVQQRIQEERTRRIQAVVSTVLDLLLFQDLCDAVGRATIIVLPSDALPSSPTLLTEQNIAGPSHGRNTKLIRLDGDQNRSSFWEQQAVVQECGALLRSQLRGASPPTAAVGDYPAEAGTLPPRPPPTSWLKRTFRPPGTDHDPTGSTGKWNLGWRSEGNEARTAGSGEVVVSTKLQDVVFRMESEMGLWESRTVRCVWIDVDMGV